MSGRVKYREPQEIRQAADAFRNARELSGHNTPPIDVIYIVEVILQLDIIPIRNLFTDQHIDAALLPDLSGIYIDHEAYMAWERGSQWVEQRLRFSCAHELGHYRLHKHEIAAHRFKTPGEFKRWAADRVGYESAEYQADEFAGRFLVPLPVLTREYDTQCRMVAIDKPHWREIKGMRNMIAKRIAPRFGVNAQVIETRLDREGIWPAE